MTGADQYGAGAAGFSILGNLIKRGAGLRLEGSIPLSSSLAGSTFDIAAQGYRIDILGSPA